MSAASRGGLEEAARTSVIVVNFNGRHHLEQCLPALELQSRLPDETIVVDNNSSDGSRDYLKRCHPDVKLIELPENLGFTGGNIAGYRAATGDYVILLNNDTKPQPDWLERLTECADRLPDVGIVASHMTDWEGGYTDSAGDGCSVTGSGFKLRNGQSTSSAVPSGYVFSASAGAALYKRAMLEQVGFLDPRFFMNAEDTELAFRAQLRGWKTYLCAEAVVRHRIGASQGVHSRAHVYYSARNHAWLYLKCMPGRLMLKHAPARLLHSLLYLAFFTRKGRALAYLAGLWAAAKVLPEVLRERRTIQRSRQVSLAELEATLSPLRDLLAEKQRASGRQR